MNKGINYPKSKKKTFYLEDRIIFCANCDHNRTLQRTSSGVLACEVCISENWLYPSNPFVANFKEYNYKVIEEKFKVERTINKMLENLGNIEFIQGNNYV